MNKQQALKELEDLRAKADALEAIINKPESYGRERLRHGAGYYYINERGQLVNGEMESGHHFDEFRFKAGNYYHTKEKAEKARDRQLAYVRITDAIREQNKGWVPDWTNTTSNKYLFIYDNGLEVDSNQFIRQLPDELYGTRKSILYVIKHHADDIKLYLGVEG